MDRRIDGRRLQGVSEEEEEMEEEEEEIVRRTGYFLRRTCSSRGSQFHFRVLNFFPYRSITRQRNRRSSQKKRMKRQPLIDPLFLQTGQRNTVR